jgi:hypothetical protein
MQFLWRGERGTQSYIYIYIYIYIYCSDGPIKVTHVNLFGERGGDAPQLIILINMNHDTSQAFLKV